MLSSSLLSWTRWGHSGTASSTSGEVATTTNTTSPAPQSRTTADGWQRGKYFLARTARQMPSACVNVALNYAFQAVPLALLKKGVDAQKVLPWISFSGHTGVSISKEVAGELVELFGPKLKLGESNIRWWPYSTQGAIARLTSAIVDAGCFASGVMVASNGGKKIRDAHGNGNRENTNPSQILMEILQDFGNLELLTLMAPNGGFDWLHRIIEAGIIAAMPEAEYDFKIFRKPEWHDFAVRVAIGLGVRVGVTGLSGSGWLLSIAGQNQAAYMVAGAYSAVVPAAMRIAQPFIRDLIYQAYLELSAPKSSRREGAPGLFIEASSDQEILVRDQHGRGGGDFVSFHPMQTLPSREADPESAPPLPVPITRGSDEQGRDSGDFIAFHHGRTRRESVLSRLAPDVPKTNKNVTSLPSDTDAASTSRHKVTPTLSSSSHAALNSPQKKTETVPAPEALKTDKNVTSLPSDANAASASLPKTEPAQSNSSNVPVNSPLEKTETVPDKGMPITENVATKSPRTSASISLPS